MKSFFKGLGILIFAVLMGCCMGCFSVLWASAKSDLKTPIIVAVISSETKADYESKIEPLMKEEIKNCSLCTIRNITPYSPEGLLVVAEIPKQLEAAGSSSSFFFLNWNVKASDENKPVIESLKKLVHAGVIVVGTAGTAKDGEPSLPLNKTVSGQVPGMIIIGELAERERLPVNNYFGPEMLTALKPPKDHMGQGLGPVFFVSKLATQWNNKTSEEWLTHFKTTKSKVRRIWPGLEDFFGH